MTEEEISVTLSCQSQSIKSLQHQINEIKELTKELRVMNTALTTLTSELKHTNKTISEHGGRIDRLESVPTRRSEKFVNAIISALTSALIGFFAARL